MSIKPLITTIIPTYRRPHLLKKALQSVLSQTYPHFTVCVCDNSSDDETPDIVASFVKNDARVQYFRHPKNIGMIGNYLYGLSLIQTDYFSFLSDDDFLLPNFYEIALKQFESCPEAGFSAGSTLIKSPNGRLVKVPLSLWKREGIFMPPEGMLEMIGKYPIPTTVLFHKKILSHTSIDSENPLLWDCDYLLQIASKYPIVITKKPCGVFLHHPTSFSNHQDLEKLKESFHRLASQLEKRVPSQVYEKGKIFLQSHLIESKAGVYMSLLLAKKFPEAQTVLKELKNEPLLGKKAFIFQILFPLSVRIPFFVTLLHGVKKFKNLLRNWKEKALFNLSESKN